MISSSHAANESELHGSYVHDPIVKKALISAGVISSSELCIVPRGQCVRSFPTPVLITLRQQHGSLFTVIRASNEAACFAQSECDELLLCDRKNY